MPAQPTVPLWVAVLVGVATAIIAAALAYQDPAVIIAPVIRFLLFLALVGLNTLGLLLNIKRPSS
jgi:hypothetical protein